HTRSLRDWSSDVCSSDLNSPAWSPDGQYIVARKHFTAQRSLGAGEMWLYHRSGGDGLQLTKRPNDQKDAGEPAFSPDSRYLYFKIGRASCRERVVNIEGS